MYNRMLSLLLFALLLAASVWAQDPGVQDSLYISYAEVDAGQQAVIPVNFTNDTELAAMTIPVFWGSSDITLDSVSYVGSRIAYLSTKPVTIYASEQKVVFGGIVLTEANIPAGTGLVATLYFNVPPGTPDQMIVVDTTTRGAASTLFTNPNSSSFIPFVESGYIQVGEPVIPPHIVLAPTSMNFEGTVGYPSPMAQQLQISNSGDNSFDWTASTSSSWLFAVPNSGTAGVSFTGITVNTTGLGEGMYYDTVVISSGDADNSPQRLPVSLHMVKLPPRIVADPEEFIVSAVQFGANPDDRILHISTDVLGSDLNWTVSNSESWLTLSPGSGTPPDSVTLSFDISGLTFGYYYDTIVISDPNAVNNPVEVPVTLQIVSDLPVLEITPDTLHIVAKTGVNPAVRSVFLWNSGEGSMTFDISESSPLITNVLPLSGSAPSDVFFTFDTDTLEIGDYYIPVTVVSPEAVNSPKELIVHIRVLSNPPDLYIIPSSLTMNYYECWQGVDASPVLKNFQIMNLGGGSMSWTATTSADWVYVKQASGVGDYINSVGLTDAAGDLPVGTYTDTLVVASAVAMNSPKKLVVTLNVIPGTETPEIVVNEAVVNIPAQEVFGVLFGELASLGEVVNQNAGCMDYWIEEDIPWLTVIDSVGEAPTILRAILDVGSYTYGTYPDSILIHSSTASNSPIVMPVNMLVWRLHGDHDWNNRINVADVVWMVKYIFQYGPPAQPEPYVDDCDCNFMINIGDAVIVVNYIFKYGNMPCGNL
ncbi:MAG: hypothetical protein R3F48_07075 [Candidatus Zixiibacteriota bacterium]